MSEPSRALAVDGMLAGQLIDLRPGQLEYQALTYPELHSPRLSASVITYHRYQFAVEGRTIWCLASRGFPGAEALRHLLSENALAALSPPLPDDD